MISFRRPGGVWMSARWAGVWLLVSAAAAAAGIAATTKPTPVLVLTGLITACLLIGDVTKIERAGAMTLVGGAVLLDYGFSNLGVQTGAAPVPLAEILLLALLLLGLVRPGARLPARVSIPLGLFVLLVALRLLFDYPVWHAFALRDSTTAIEALAVILGYRAVSRDGVAFWTRRLGWLLAAVLAYNSLFPWRNFLAAHGPVVGLTRPVPLFGGISIGGTAAVVAACIFFALYTKGAARILLMGWAIAILAVDQQRGLYIALVLAVLVLGWALRRHAGTWARLGTAVGVGVIVLVLAAGMGFSGRLGQITPAFYLTHVKTLAGDKGPGSGSFHQRIQWTRETLHKFDQSPTTLAFGVGLGPDLAFGFRGPSGSSVRKPHDDYLEVLARTGVIGLTVFLWLLASLLGPVVRRVRATTSEDRRFFAFVLAATAGYLAVAATQPELAYPSGSVPVFFLLGMANAALLPQARRESVAATT